MMSANLHDTYAFDYDRQAQSCGCHVADLLFGLCYAFSEPGQRLLDAGIGSGLSAQPFARAGLEVHGMDFSPAMLAQCQAKRFAASLTQHDLRQAPWPYPAGGFDHVICCGVLHFIGDLATIFDETARVLAQGGVFSFTTQIPTAHVDSKAAYDRRFVGDFEVLAHVPTYVDTLLAKHALALLKQQTCVVGDDLFILWVVRKS
jgi:predicted TPR repeat methyltransferase